MKFCRLLTTLIFFLCAITPVITARGATLTAGKIPIQVPKNTVPSPASPTPVLDDESHSQTLRRSNTKEELIQSDKFSEIKKGFEAIEANLVHLLEEKPKIQKIVARAQELLSHPSVNVRMISQRFLEKNMEAFLEQRIITAESFSKTVQKAYRQEDGLLQSLSLFGLILPHNNADTRKILDPEHTYMVIDALESMDNTTLTLVEKIMVLQGGMLAEKHLWEDRHTQIFLQKINKLPLKNQMLFLRIIDANLNRWVENGILDRQNFIDMLTKMNLDDIAFQERLIGFFTSPKNTNALKKINLFDHEWVKKLATNITGEVQPEEKDFSLRLVTFLLPAFASSGGITETSYQKLWQHIQNNMEAFVDPLQIVSFNFDFLSRHKWFDAGHLKQLLDDFEHRSTDSQSIILKFVDKHYHDLTLSGWIYPEQMAAMLFAKSSSTQVDAQKLDFIHRHKDLVQTNNIYDKKTIKNLMQTLATESGPESAVLADILDHGFDTWAKQGLINNKDLQQLYSVDISYPHAAALLDIAMKNFPGHKGLFDRETIVSMAQMSFSPLPEVQKKTVSFFKNNYPELKNQVRNFNGKLRQVFRQAGFWDEISQRNRSH